jgi:threonylcarbamoyladenosine tRNA methylthiotransferase MtaB
VTGCYATRRPEELSALPNVDCVVPNDDKPSLVPVIIRRQSGVEQAEVSTADRFGDGNGNCGASIEPGVAGRTAYTLRVQTGCAEACSYCIIPATRGRPRSVAQSVVLAEIDRVMEAGFKEIAITGVHLGSYGRDLAPQASLASLLQTMASHVESGMGRCEGVFRISSLEPVDCSPAIVDLIAEHAAFAPHFHLPLQHASDVMLERMRRGYTVSDYEALVARIHRRLPHASIGTDVIVGFPGEADHDFARLCSYLEASPITHVHVFPYSDRPGTAASEMQPKVPPPIIRARAARIREISRRLASDFWQRQIGAVYRALTLDDGRLAVTGNYLKVRIPPGHARNEWISVRIEAEGEAALHA